MSDNVPESVFTMNGWCTKEKANYMYDLVVDAKSSLTVELGVFAGRSAIPMMLAHKKMGLGKVVAIDPWKVESSITNYDENDANREWWGSINHDEIHRLFLQSIKRYDVANYAEVVRAESRDVVSRFEDESIDILHQDGNHTEGISTEEVNLYAPKMRKGGYWVMDDTNWATTGLAQRTILTKGFSLVYDHVDWKVYKKN
jgi:predicted O-methyltransferase YrrM